VCGPSFTGDITVIYWNSCKKGTSVAGKICRRIREHFGNFVGLLQEVPTWGKLNGFTYAGHTIVSFENCACGLVIPRLWMLAVRSHSFGAYWCGVVISNYIFISAHMLDHHEEDGRASNVLKETFNYVQGVRKSYPDVDFDVIIGVDADVGFPAKFEGISGTAVLPLKQSHTLAKIRVVAAWADALGVRALNTFENAAVMIDGRLDHKAARTRMAKRRPATRTQIDFVMVSAGLHGYALARSLLGRVFARSDHRFVIG
jgi:hypothetical protein